MKRFLIGLLMLGWVIAVIGWIRRLSQPANTPAAGSHVVTIPDAVPAESSNPPEVTPPPPGPPPSG
jgi:hypothetical protein